MVEVHPRPDEALSDGEQSLTFDRFRDLMAARRPAPRAGQPPARRSAALGPPRSASAGRRSIEPLDPTVAAARCRDGRPRACGGRACAASCGCPATSRSPTAPCSWPPLAEGSLAIASAATAPDVGSRRGIVPACGRSGAIESSGAERRRRARRLPGRRRRAATRWRAPDGTARLRQLRHHDAPAGGPARGPAAGRDPRRRRFAARPADGAASRARCGRWAPRSTARGDETRAAAARHAVAAAPVDRLDDRRAERPGEVGHPAGRPGRGRRRRSVTEAVGHARPHRADAARPRRGGRVRGRRSRRKRRRPARCRSPAGQAVRPLDEAVPGDISAAAFWLVAGAAHPDAELALERRRRRTRRGGPSSTSCGRMGAAIEERDRRRAGRRERASRLADLTVRTQRAAGPSTCRPADVAAAIDEIPVARAGRGLRARHDPGSAARASCATRSRDRIAGIVEGLRALGADVTRGRRRHRDRGRAGRTAFGLGAATDAQPRRSPARDDVRGRRPHRRGHDGHRRRARARRSRIPASSRELERVRA